MSGNKPLNPLVNESEPNETMHTVQCCLEYLTNAKPQIKSREIDNGFEFLMLCCSEALRWHYKQATGERLQS